MAYGVGSVLGLTCLGGLLSVGLGRETDHGNVGHRPARCPGGRPIDTVYGPKQPTPDLPGDVRALAAAALDRVTADESGLVETWVDPAEARQWLLTIKSLRDVLDPLPVVHDVPLFDA